jgi:hypothetical protein
MLFLISVQSTLFLDEGQSYGSLNYRHISDTMPPCANCRLSLLPFLPQSAPFKWRNGRLKNISA